MSATPDADFDVSSFVLFAAQRLRKASRGDKG
jgi:hypothetical protein